MSDLVVKIDSSVPESAEGVVSFETGINDPANWCYEHNHTPNPRDPGALTLLYQDILLGREMPTTFHTKTVGGIDTIMAIALFLNRKLFCHSDTMSLVANVDFVHRLGISAMAVQSADYLNLFTALNTILGITDPKKLEQDLPQAVQWIEEFINLGKCPTHLLESPPTVQVIEQGTGGFVIASSDSDVLGSWLELYRCGFLKGILFCQGNMIISKRSFLVSFDLVKAASTLNAAESAAKGNPSSAWIVSPDELWLYHVEPTILLASDVLTVLIHS